MESKTCASCYKRKIIDCFQPPGNPECMMCASRANTLEDKLRQNVGKHIHNYNYDIKTIHGCTLEFLMDWLEFTKRFYVPNNFRGVLHIDHLLPKSRFEARDAMFVHNWSNLRYLPSYANLKKGWKMPPKEDLEKQATLCYYFLYFNNFSGGARFETCIDNFEYLMKKDDKSYYYFTNRRRF